VSLPAELERLRARASRGTAKAARARETIGDDSRALDAELAVPSSNADRDEASVTRHAAKYRRSSSESLLAFGAAALGLIAFALALVDVSGRVGAGLQTVSALTALAASGLLLGWLVRGPRA
jgi:hypothetical protein